MIVKYQFRILLAVTIPFCFTAVKAQQLPLYSQYMMNKFLVNPAVAGAEGYTAINLTAREQWIGFSESPKTHAFSAQTRVLRNSFISKSASIRKRRKSSTRSGKVGLGGYVFDDRTGILARTGLQLTYAYHLFIHTGQLSFGLSGTAYQMSIDREKLRLESTSPSDDPFFQKVGSAMIIPDANVGIYYSNPKMYTGLSASHLFQASLKFGNKGYDEYRMLRHFHFMGGYNIDISDNVIMEPSFLLKSSENWELQLDVGSKVFFLENYWGGVLYRTGGALIAMGGVQVDKFYFGYAFDYTLSSMMKHSLGSHEFMVAVKFGDTARRYRWLIRY